ncbi:tetratricopeptide repeat protein [Bacteroidota bacterium]
MRRFIFSFFTLIFLSQHAFALYDVNENCKKAWMLVMDLQIDQAKKVLADEIRKNPENYYAYYLEQTCDVFRLLINSSDADYEEFVKNFEKKREIMDDKDEDSPYYLACYAEMELQVSVFSVMHGSQWSGLTKGYSAYKNVYRNIERFPTFQPNRKLDGFFNVAIANLPPFVKWAISFFGVKVDMDYGFRTLNQYYLSNKNVEGLNAEAALYMILAAKINKTPERVYEFTKSLEPSVANTFIQSYFRANIAYRTGRNEEALKTLQQVSHNENGIADVIYSYLMGKVLLRKLDPGAGQYLSRYLSHLEKKEYMKEMNYNLALFYLLQGSRDKYQKQCEIVRKEGMDLNERDREALYDAKLDYPPDINLVKARLSIDGGYLEEFQKAMKSFEAGHEKIDALEIEYHFLKGRYEAMLKNNNLAISEFKKVIELGENEDYYFACEASLRLGKIYQQTGQKTLAEECYKKSIKLYKSDFYEYIEDKARKGLNSL